MSNNYDNWERLVQVVLRREHDRELALAHSRDPSFSSSIISDPSTPIHENQNIQPGSSSGTVKETDWERLLLSDYEDIISRSADPVTYATMKELYLSLSYLVYGFANSYKGSPSLANAIISFDRIKDGDAHNEPSVLNLNPLAGINGDIAMRPDKWMEVEIGVFYTDQEDNSVVKVRVWENKRGLKSGLLVEGIEFRPPNANIVIFPKKNEREKKRESKILFKP
ncbi:Hypothetical predicted protein [Olea europaea subsp. europaea]|uniref:Uncharacterized protein n=1 Tax=Olea europaea subsp. europaea TaxID=158383 RepID=A0A8S0PXG6_OLEEU|nr:Hypothetical predicted protein [Olea europaea subsp. europaea]